MSVIPLDQASRLRALVGEQARTVAPRGVRKSAHVIAIASGKGGVGKTNIAVNLAISLVQRGLKIVLVDADLGMANIDVILNSQSRWDLSHVIRRQKRIEEIAIEIEPGLKLVAGASGLSGVADLQPFERVSLLSELSQLESACDVMLLDCGAGISQNVLAFAQAADELLVVTTPEPTALTDAYALIKVLGQANLPMRTGLLINQVRNAREGELIAQRIMATAERFLGVRLFTAGQILRDENVGAAVRQRCPFVVRYPRSPASTCLSALAERVAQCCRPVVSSPGFFHRVMSFFCLNEG